MSLDNPTYWLISCLFFYMNLCTDKENCTHCSVSEASNAWKKYTVLAFYVRALNVQIRRQCQSMPFIFGDKFLKTFKPQSDLYRLIPLVRPSMTDFCKTVLIALYDRHLFALISSAWSASSCSYVIFHKLFTIFCL